MTVHSSTRVQLLQRINADLHFATKSGDILKIYIMLINFVF